MKKIVLIIVCFGSAFLANAVNPKKEYNRTPDSLDIKYIDSYISTKDNYKIHQWDLIQKNDSSKIIIFVGGDSGNMSSNLFCAKSLVEKGYHVILFDYRGFGSSSSFKTERNILFYPEFIIDLQAVVIDIRKKYPNAKIGLLAQSMGTIITTLLSNNEKFEFLIFDGLLNSPLKTCSDGYNKTVYCPNNYLESNYQNCLNKIDIPVLIFQGDEDDICLEKDTKEYVQKNVKRKILVYNGYHLEGFRILTKSKPGDIYIEKIDVFLQTI